MSTRVAANGNVRRRELMNARQKAKKYKRLYEETMARIIQPKIIYEAPLKHYKLAHRIQMDVPMGLPNDFLMSRTVKILTDGLREVVERNMEVEKDIQRREYVFKLDFWARK